MHGFKIRWYITRWDFDQSQISKRNNSVKIQQGIIHLLSVISDGYYKPAARNFRWLKYTYYNNCSEKLRVVIRFNIMSSVLKFAVIWPRYSKKCNFLLQTCISWPYIDFFEPYTDILYFIDTYIRRLWTIILLKGPLLELYKGPTSEFCNRELSWF